MGAGEAGSAARSRRASFFDRGQVARLRSLPLLAPAANLPLDVAVGVTEALEAGGAVVDRVDRDEHVDQRFGAPARVVPAESRSSSGGVRRMTPSTFSMT